MLSIGNSDPTALYDFALTVSNSAWTTLDPESEIYKTIKLVVDSAWGQLPPYVLFDFQSDDITPKPPINLIWDETEQRYI